MTDPQLTAHAVVAHMDEGQKRALLRFHTKGAKGISDYRKGQLTARALLTPNEPRTLTAVGEHARTIILEDYQQ